MDLTKTTDKEKLGNLGVHMSNPLTKAAHGLSINEKRIISAAIAQLDSRKRGVLPDHNQMRVKFTAQEFASIYGIDTKAVYKDLLDACERLMKRYVRIIEETPKGRKEIKFNWVSGVVYHHGEGWVELGFSHEITPHLTMLRGCYTGYKLNKITGFGSVYFWRFYELLVMASRGSSALSGKLLITIENLRHALEIPSTYRYPDIKRRIILPFCDEMKKNHGFEMVFSESKKGRSVNSISLRFKEDTQLNLTLISKNDLENS